MEGVSDVEAFHGPQHVKSGRRQLEAKAARFVKRLRFAKLHYFKINIEISFFLETELKLEFFKAERKAKKMMIRRLTLKMIWRIIE